MGTAENHEAVDWSFDIACVFLATLCYEVLQALARFVTDFLIIYIVVEYSENIADLRRIQFGEVALEKNENLYNVTYTVTFVLSNS